MEEPFAQLSERMFSDTDREVIYRLIRSRRDVRQFAPDPIPTDALLWLAIGLCVAPVLAAEVD